MKKILKILNGILVGTAVLLAGSCAAILLYSKFHINQDKNNYTLAEQNTGDVLYDNSTETYISNISDMEDVLADSNEEYITADLNDENIQEALSMEQVYDVLCDKFSLTEDNLSYYGELDINGEPYYGFQVIDAGGGEWDSLLVYNRNTNKEYFYDVLGNISEVEKDKFADINVYENITTYPDTQETVNGSWEDMFNKYIAAMINKDRKKATSFTDTSCYTWSSGSKAKFEATFIEELEKYQENFIESVEALDASVALGELDSYSLYYEINTIDPYEDEYGVECVDVYFRLRGNFSANGMTSENVSIRCYRISLRKYPIEGWKVIWLYVGW